MSLNLIHPVGTQFDSAGHILPHQLIPIPAKWHADLSYIPKGKHIVNRHIQCFEQALLHTAKLVKVRMHQQLCDDHVSGKNGVQFALPPHMGSPGSICIERGGGAKGDSCLHESNFPEDGGWARTQSHLARAQFTSLGKFDSQGITPRATVVTAVVYWVHIGSHSQVFHPVVTKHFPCGMCFRYAPYANTNSN